MQQSGGVDELRDEIRQTVQRLVALIRLRHHDACHRLRLGRTDCWFLTLLAVHGPLTPGRLAVLTGKTSGTITCVVDRLERAGFAARERDSADRRKVLVVLAPDAATLLAAEYGEWLDLLDAAPSVPTPAERTYCGPRWPTAIPASRSLPTPPDTCSSPSTRRARPPATACPAPRPTSARRWPEPYHQSERLPLVVRIPGGAPLHCATSASAVTTYVRRVRRRVAGASDVGRSLRMRGRQPGQGWWSPH
jgi:DNA-binding MarR family transcriptional regulator